MVSRSSTQKKQKQKQKRTYVERVMNAISDVRRRHRKGVVHVSSLRQQVKKNAAAEHDQLGPHWQTWVGLALNDLKTRGVLTATPPRGSVAVTPEANSRIVQARRSYLKAARHGHAQSESAAGSVAGPIAWRQIIRQFPLDDARYSGDSSTPRPTSTAAHRPRRSVGNHDESLSQEEKPLSKMNKSELYAAARALRNEVDKLKADFAAFSSERRSELGELNLRLMDKDKELERLKIAATNEYEDDEDDEGLCDTTLVDDPGLKILSTDIPNQVQEPQPVVISRPSLKRAPEGLERTISGSFIHSISKRPTPAPSDASSSSDHGSPAPMFFEELGDPDVEDTDQTYVEPDADADELDDRVKTARFKEGLQLHSPVTTPTKVSRCRVSSTHERKEVEDDLRRRIDALMEERLEEQQTYESKLNALETTLEARNAEVRYVETQLNTRTSECKTLQDRLASLQKSQEGLTALLQQHTSAKEQAKQLLDDNARLRQVNERLEAELKERDAELEECRDQVREIVGKVVQADCEASNLRAELERKSEAFEGVEKQRMALSAQLECTQEEVGAVQSELQARSLALENVLAERETLKGQVTVMRLELQESQATISTLESDVHRAADEATALRAQLESVQALYAMEEGRRECAEHELTTAQIKHTEYANGLDTHLRELEGEVAERETELRHARAKNEAMRASVLSANIQVAQLRGVLEASREIHDKQSEMLTEEVRALQSALDGSREREAGLQKALKAAESELEQTEGLLDTVRTAYGRLRRQIDDVDSVIMKTARTSKKRKLDADADMIRDDDAMKT